jgi:hypothetical protein
MAITGDTMRTECRNARFRCQLKYCLSFSCHTIGEGVFDNTLSGSRISRAVRRLNTGDHPPGVFQVGRHCVKKFCRRCAIDHAMVERQAEEHH